MSICGSAPHYILAEICEDGLIDYVIMNPRGWVADEVIHRCYCMAGDEEQMISRAKKYFNSRQTTIKVTYVDELDKCIGGYYDGTY